MAPQHREPGQYHVYGLFSSHKYRTLVVKTQVLTAATSDYKGRVGVMSLTFYVGSPTWFRVLAENSSCKLEISNFSLKMEYSTYPRDDHFKGVFTVWYELNARVVKKCLKLSI